MNESLPLFHESEVKKTISKTDFLRYTPRSLFQTSFGFLEVTQHKNNHSRSRKNGRNFDVPNYPS
jgi:hypothetical protein